eukprot:s4735_g2.t1
MCPERYPNDKDSGDHGLGSRNNRRFLALRTLQGCRLQTCIKRVSSLDLGGCTVASLGCFTAFNMADDDEIFDQQDPEEFVSAPSFIAPPVDQQVPSGEAPLYDETRQRSVSHANKARNVAGSVQNLCWSIRK